MYQSLFKAQVSFLPSVQAKGSGICTIPLAAALLSDRWRAQVEAVRAEADPDKRRALKAALPCFTPAGTITRQAGGGDRLAVPSGFLCVDIDAKDNAGVTDFASLKEKAAQVPCIAYCGRSCGGAGFFVLIPIADPAKYRDYYKALQADFARCGLRIDPACKDLCRKRFVSWEPDPYINTGAQPYAYTLPAQARTRPEPPAPEDLPEIAAQVEAVIRTCEAERWDITADRAKWVKILAALAHAFGEAGRDYAHRISALYPGYDPGETDKTFTSVLKPPADGEAQAVTIASFFSIAREEMGKHDFDELLHGEAAAPEAGGTI